MIVFIGQNLASDGGTAESIWATFGMQEREFFTRAGKYLENDNNWPDRVLRNLARKICRTRLIK
ncbi:hypothetical protein ACFVWF_29620 [Rhodococcus qingshengii]|uniref:hypothetical protein n=1 Tax=Rhodococcus qingshengii TaxID=334542 RepID=UPI0036D7612B